MQTLSEPLTWHSTLLSCGNQGQSGQAATFKCYIPMWTLASGTDPTDQQPEQGSTATHERMPGVPDEHCHALGWRLQPTLPLFTLVSQLLFRQKHHLSHRQSHHIPGRRTQALAPRQSPWLFLASPFPPWCCPEGNLLLLPGLGPDPAARQQIEAGLGTVATGGGTPTLSGSRETLSQEQTGTLGI